MSWAALDQFFDNINWGYCVTFLKWDNWANRRGQEGGDMTTTAYNRQKTNQ